MYLTDTYCIFHPMSIRSWVQSFPVGQRQRVIARLAEAAGVQPSAVRHWVAGNRGIHPKRLKAVSEVTGLPIEALIPSEQVSRCGTRADGEG